MDYRHEQKYICSAGQMIILEARLKGILSVDSHTPGKEAPGQNGYLVRSVYLDDLNDRMLDENLDGVDDRVKFRLRLYNADPSFIRLEIKRKKNSLTHKDECSLSPEQAESILSGRCPPIDRESPEPLRYLYAEMNTSLLRPKVLIEYRRTAMVGRPGNVRVTFDRQAGCTADCTRFLSPTVALRPLLAAGQGILEIKYDALLPDWVAQSVELGELSQTTFSKYASARLLLRNQPLF